MDHTELFNLAFRQIERPTTGGFSRGKDTVRQALGCTSGS